MVALVLGVTGGLVAGYYGGWFDSVSSWLTGLLMALPGMVVLLAARAVLGPSMWLSMMIFGILLSPAYFRLVYASVTAVRNELYVDAARVSGLSDVRIIGRHILTVVRAPVIIQAAMILGHRHRHPGGPGIPGPRRPEHPHLGQHAQRRVRQHLQGAHLGPVARPRDRR